MIHRIRTQMNRKGDGFELEIGQPRCEEPYYGSNVCMSVMKLKIIAFQGRVVKWIAENCEFANCDCEKIAI